MADLHQIRQNFSSMPDEKLLHIATHERNTLTKEALAVFIEVYKTRPLDASIFEPTPEELDYDKEQHWFFALEEKRKGKTAEELYGSLTARNLKDEQAAAIISRLPEPDINDEDFETYIKHQCEHVFLAGNFARVLIIGTGICAIAYGTMKFFVPFTILGIAMLLLAVCFKIGTKHGGAFWVNRIKHKPESIVWIKPIVEKHTVWYLITLFKTSHFQICTRDSIEITFECTDPVERNIFLTGIKKYIPHAHIGYSFPLDHMYIQNPAGFINALQHKNLYLPVADIALPPVSV
ncbi:hypothetical protein [Cytophaga hutchinsonii]|uniref:Uncharacterized protein n=1 Tax=Cytophaga hutchinsonii (strain ATCC 33406 / DSM 1761 / CIP 103989 / NBRC 15051 / NCIMB 9469 / D465) TaxID=269798 RepID=A0A6N4SQ78_CYTH3|nr:hypothetical protein [Cytophaga hutchinsonii]ABG58441.1 hypothetical protein CHU_1166 [Cytophaga hutchinsonii ATCC 33406]SFX74544.1 hypothetical protein SAMN04487930_1099 [Cytophaga hutchinsonii ATCC 33406]